MFTESDIWVPQKCEESMELLDMAYRREFISIADVEDQHADAIGREAFALFMDACDRGYTPQATEFQEVPCDTFELQIAKLAGACAAERRRRITSATMGVLPKLNPFSRHARRQDLVGYGESAVVRTLLRIRETDDDIYERLRPLEIPQGHAAKEVTKELLVEERTFYL